MAEQKGKLIVIDGLDGSGKATQSQLFAQWLTEQDISTRKISFPNYGNKSSTLVQMYLAGEVGGLHEVNSYAASSFYSVDRYISYQTIWKNWYLAGEMIVADRYTTSNACHQMVKLPREEWDGFLDWLVDFEYEKLELPQPDQVFYLDMHPETSRNLLRKRYQGDASKMDIHEANYAYLVSCREAALYAAQRWNWTVIRCDNGLEPYPIETIAQQVQGEYLKWSKL